MKKYITVIVAACGILLLVGCGSATGSKSVQTNTPIVQQTPTQSPEKEDQEAKVAMIMVDGKLYLDTGKESEVQARCGVMDGQVTSYVDRTEVPTENNQSNFGSGFGYQYGTEKDTIEIVRDGKWIVFKCSSEDTKK